jgi:hypothetical protein
VIGEWSGVRGQESEVRSQGSGVRGRHEDVRNGGAVGKRTDCLQEGIPALYAHLRDQHCDGENSETDTSLDYALDCGYIMQGQYDECTAMGTEVGRMLGSMIEHPEPFLLTPDP